MDETLLLVIPSSAFLLSLVLFGLSLVLFPRLGLLDFPERYGLTRRRIPYPTGIVAVIVFLLFYSLLAPASMKTACTLLAVALLGISSFIDDRTPLPPLLRLSLQTIIALVLFVGGARILSFTNPLESLMGPAVLRLDAWNVTLPALGAIAPLSALFTILWIGLTVNALNWFDGLPGQVSSLSTIGFLTIGFLSLSERVNQPFLALISFILAAIALAALLFELRPATMVLGDSGAMFFGLLLGLLTIYSGGKVATAFLVLGVPLIDFIIVIARRLRKRKNPLRGNAVDEHLHHRLLRKGWNRGSIVLLTACIGTAFGLSALFFSTQEKFLAALVLFLVMLLLSWYSKPVKAS